MSRMYLVGTFLQQEQWSYEFVLKFIKTPMPQTKNPTARMMANGAAAAAQAAAMK